MTDTENRISIKTAEEIEIIREGGKKLGTIKADLKELIREGVKASLIEEKASELIKKAGGQASFKMVPGYSWSTCVNVNTGLVHGIPRDSLIFQKGDVISVDLGMVYQGFHTDTSFTEAIKPTKEIESLLKAGRLALEKSIKATRKKNRIYDISKAIEETIKAFGYSPIKALVGHGIGRNLHEGPQIPCFTSGQRQTSPEIKEGMILAIEVMYAQGKEDVVLDDDGWTISMADGKISALFEETVAVLKNGPEVLTKDSHP